MIITMNHTYKIELTHDELTTFKRVLERMNERDLELQNEDMLDFIGNILPMLRTYV